MLGGEKLRNQAVWLIESHYGSETAGMYREFYKDKDDKTVIESVTELLVELLGRVKADELIKNLLK